MDTKTAENLARKYLSEKIELEVLDTPPQGVYLTNSEEVFYIRFALFENQNIVGPSKYLTVSKLDGTVKYVGSRSE